MIITNEELVRLFLYENKCFITHVIYNNLKAKFAYFTVKSIYTQKRKRFRKSLLIKIFKLTQMFQNISSLTHQN